MVSYSQTSDFKTHNKDFLARKPTEIIFGKKKKKKIIQTRKTQYEYRTLYMYVKQKSMSSIFLIFKSCDQCL